MIVNFARYLKPLGANWYFEIFSFSRRLLIKNYILKSWRTWKYRKFIKSTKGDMAKKNLKQVYTCNYSINRKRPNATFKLFKISADSDDITFEKNWYYAQNFVYLREWVSLIWASSKVISRQTSKGDIPKTFVTNRTNLRGNF